MKGIEKYLIFFLIITIFIGAILIGWFSFYFPGYEERLEDTVLGLQGKEPVSLEAGHKALHVKILPEATPEVWEFHLTEQLMHISDKTGDIGTPDIKQYFKIKNWDNNRCTLYLTKKTPPPSPLGVQQLDKNYVAYIRPGSIIQDGITDMKSGVAYDNFDDKCKRISCNDMPESYTICVYNCFDLCWGRFGFECDKNAADNVLDQDFNKDPATSAADRCNEFTDGCPYMHGEAECCNLLQVTAGGHDYRIKYGLVCGYSGGNAMWYACTDMNNGMVVNKDPVGGIQFKCKYSGGVGKWETREKGLVLDNAKIKYQGIVDSDTDIIFSLINYKENLNAVSIKTKIIDSPSEYNCGDVFTDDYKEYTDDCGDMKLFSICSFGEGSAFRNLIPPNYFCFKAKTFEVEVASGSFTQKFVIKCSTADPNVMDKWYSCDAYKGEYMKIGDTVTKTCGSDSYTIKLESVNNQNKVLLLINSAPYTMIENENMVLDGKLDITVGDVDYNSAVFANSKAVINLDCVQ